MRRQLLNSVFVIASFLLLANANASTTMNYQGILADSSGIPLSGSYDVTFRLFDVPSGGGVLWEEMLFVSADAGLFSVTLGEIEPLVFSAYGTRPDSLWLEIQIDIDPPVTPRTRLAASPLAAIATGLRGDLLSSPGQLFIIDSIGDTTIRIDGRNKGNVISVEDHGMGLFVTDSASFVRASHTDQTLGTSVITELVAGLPPGTPVVRQSNTPPSTLIMRNVTNVGLDTTTIVEIGAISSGGFFTVYDSLGDTSIVIDSKTGDRISLVGFSHKMNMRADGFNLTDSLGDTIVVIDSKKADKISLVGFSHKMNMRADGFNLTDSLGDTIVQISSADSGGGFIRLLPKGASDTVMKIVLDVRPDKFVLAQIPPGGGSSGTIELSFDRFSYVDTTGDTNFVWDNEGNLRSSGKKGYDYYMAKSSFGTVSNLGDSLFTVDSLGNANIGSSLRVGAIDQIAEVSVAGDICYTGAISACSDARFKKDIASIESSLEKVSKMYGITYRWKRDEFPTRNFDDNRHLGFIAQDIEQLFPELVMTDKNGYKSVDYSRLAPILVEAIKEQQKQIEELTKLVQQIADRAESKPAAEYGQK